MPESDAPHDAGDRERIELKREDGLVRVTLTSDDGRNALDDALAAELLSVVGGLAADGARCLVLSGSGDAFSVGADLRRFEGDASDAARIRSLATTMHDVTLRLHRAPVPVVTGVNGVAAGGGFSLALCGDVVVASEAARFEYAYPRIGLPGDGGATYFLPRLVGLRRARELVLRDDPVGPERAVELGLVSEAVPAAEFDARLTEVAERLASGPTEALGAVRRLMAESFERGLGDQLAAEAEAVSAAARTDDYRRGYRAFFEGGDPAFEGE